MLSGAEFGLESIADQESFVLNSFELLIVIQFIFVWMLSWRWNLRVYHSSNTIRIVVLFLLILTLMVTYCVFTYDPFFNYPMTMVYRRLFAFQSWFLLTALSIYLQLTIINPTLYSDTKTKTQ